MDSLPGLAAPPNQRRCQRVQGRSTQRGSSSAKNTQKTGVKLKRDDIKSVLTVDDRTALETAVFLLENPGFIARVGDFVGAPIEKAIAMLPSEISSKIGSAAQKAILASLRVAIKTMTNYDPKRGAPPESSDWWHKGAVSLTGGIGGAFGILALTVELPISTTIMMRSIADIARSEGAHIQEMKVQLECVKVLALGGRTTSDDGAEVGYFAAREALAKAAADAAKHIAAHGLEQEGAPALLRFILEIAERYAITVSEKAAAQAIPVIGALGGAAINVLFMDHFQDVARGHFTVQRLEGKYGRDIVDREYRDIRAFQKQRK